MPRDGETLSVAVIGGGIAGMSCAWLLSHAHDVVLYEQAGHVGGHSLTKDVAHPAGSMPVDMGFIVYNPPAYPNLTALFSHLAVPTRATEMSFAVSLRGGGLEYSGTNLAGLFGQPRNLVRPRFWAMLRDTARFYRAAARDAGRLDEAVSLAAYLRQGGYGEAFTRDHLLPMAAAIWSAPAAAMGAYPAAAFIRFCDNHGLLRLRDRPQWRTVLGGSREYVRRLTARYATRMRLNCAVRAIRRDRGRVWVRDAGGAEQAYDHVVIGAHADQALAMLSDPSEAETTLLGRLRYGRNEAIMHRDPRFMPRRRRVWSAWNYLERVDGADLCATYWMNRLQALPDPEPVLVTLNPGARPAPNGAIAREIFHHPLFDAAAMRAQRDLWRLQGDRNTWFCGAYFGAGFHEDGLQAGLAVAEALGGVRRPWTVPGESARIALPPQPALARAA